VTRLRETPALVGFARIEAPDSGLAEDAEDASIVPLTTGSPYWVPAADVRGQGIFLQLPEDRVRAWEARVEKHSRIRALREAIIEVRRRVIEHRAHADATPHVFPCA